ncbi:hypothetical protein D9619_003592 [Psilocybe cf. subviscida]|uniref:Uncharacterized protein n=1 Tax=Psilocybe cf. subviscida TaxID=2480587 RepID=A0A8H5AY49_9AGAR|nr:hypothetical protein D9619_003592 [Psilocybe cf. subviscida]
MSVTTVSSATAPSTIVSILRCLSTASASIPIPGIAPAIAIVSAIMEIVESIRTAKNDCRALAEKAAQLVITLHQEAASLDNNSPVYGRIQGNIDSFKRILEEIQAFILKLSRRRKIKRKIKLVWKRDSVLQRVVELSNSLDTCYKTFQITSFVHLQTALSQFTDEQVLSAQRIHQRLAGVQKATLKAQEQGVVQLTSEIRAIEHNMASAWRSDITATTKLLEQVAVDVKNSAVQYTNSMVTTLCEIEPVQVHIPMTRYHGGVTAARYRNKGVLVKQFQEAKDFVQELSIWRELWHPHLPRLIAFSSESERRPFVVLDCQVVSGDMRTYILDSLKEGVVAGLMAGLQIIYGLSTALDYLRVSNLLSKAELTKCLQLSDIVLSNKNGVILGGNLLSCAAIRPSVPACHFDETMDEYLAEKLFLLMLQILCPETRFACLEINSPRSFTSVLRLLLLFSSFQFKNGRSLTQIRTKSDSAWATLGQKKRAPDCRISFADVRDCFLQIEGMGPSRTNVPRPHWNISTGDIGYVKDDNFVLIANVFDDDTPTFCGDTPGLGASHEEILMIRCDPCRPYNLTELPDGSKRYEFDAPAFALLWHSHRFGIDDRLAMKYLLRHANFYLEKSGLSHRLNPSDIIMVVNRETRPRHSGSFDFVHDDSSQEGPPEKVYFFESYDSLPSSQWGYWSLNPDREDLLAGLQSNITDPRVTAECSIGGLTDMFDYIQLEEEDVVETP